MDKTVQYLTIAQAAEFLNVSKTSLRRWTNKNALKCYRIGSRNERRFLLEDLKAFMPASSPEPSGMAGESHEAGCSEEAHGHLCTQYVGREEQWALLRPHFLSHLTDDARIVYLYDESKTHIGEWLANENLDIGLLKAAGTLRLVPAAESYLKDGHFDSRRMLDFWTHVIAAAERDGIKRLLLSGEMAWSTRGAPGSEALVPYENELDDLLRDYPWVTTVCQYDLSAFSAETMFRALCTHPLVQLKSGLVPGLR